MSSVDQSLHCLTVSSVLTNRTGHTYIIDRILGQGGFGITYAGREMTTNSVVAIKEYFPGFCSPIRHSSGKITASERPERYASGLKSFLKEASLLVAFSHNPSIVHVLDYFEANDTAYMVMEYLDGVTLQHVIEQNGAMPFDELLPKLRVLMKDLDTLHKSEVLHRDISPSNIMLMPDGSLRLIDFGCARSMQDDHMTVMVNPEFAPAEQYNTNGQGPFTDVYALCATIYFCITGGRRPQLSTERLLSDTLVRPSEYGAEISEIDERALLWGLSPQPKDRPQSIAALATAFHSDTSSKPDTQDISGTSDMREPKPLQLGALIAGGAIALLLVLMVLAFAARYL